MRGIDTTAAILPFKRSDVNEPDAARLITALRQIGYSLEQAIADLVDNSVNASAGNVLIRFLHDGNTIQSVAVVDDGFGMNEEQMHNAMRFGSSESSQVGSLGKFGMGLKLASLSYARSLNVVSVQDSVVTGRQWTIDGISNGWQCGRLRTEVAEDLVSRKWGSLDLSSSGTMVVWDEVDRLPSHGNGLKYTLTSIDTRLRLHLGMCFHRFLENQTLRIYIDQMLVSRVGQGIQSEIAPLNPFGYAHSGHPDYPKKFCSELTGIGPMELEAHIWPANDESDNYRLGRRAAARQGFYFYRNRRLIQAGGWNGLVHDETEPHSSLARVSVDLPIEFDSEFGINVQKSTVIVPPVFSEVLHSCTNRGESFDSFRRDAVSTYREANSLTLDIGRYPSSGLDKKSLEKLRQMYERSESEQGFNVRWVNLDPAKYFHIDSQARCLLLNRKYRTSGNAKVTGLLLSLLVRADVGSSISKARASELDEINDLIVSLINR